MSEISHWLLAFGLLAFGFCGSSEVARLEVTGRPVLLATLDPSPCSGHLQAALAMRLSSRAY
jgi:hypothetical protein